MSKKAPASRRSTIREQLLEKLRDPAYASAYVNEALLEGDEVIFKTAVSDVIRARGVVDVARKAGVNRVTVFKTLKPETRTSFVTFHSLLNACDINFTTTPAFKIRKVKAKKKVKRTKTRGVAHAAEATRKKSAAKRAGR